MDPKVSGRNSISHFGLSHLALFTVVLPLGGFLFAVWGALYWNFEKSTSTHCDVKNFAPSISSAIGSEPQKFVWQFCISLHIAPRFLFSYLNARNLYEKVTLTRNQHKNALINACLILQWAENLALLTLTIISSEENFPIHKTAFVTFGLCALLYMAINVFLVTHGGYKTSNHRQRQAVTWKIRLFKLTCASCFLAGYFYWRHNAYCEKYVYSFFCLSEYMIVLANMAFHMTSYYDFYDSEVSVSKPMETYLPLHNKLET